jgi:chromosomal replication initiator protein
MANRLELGELNKVLNFAEKHIEDQNFDGAVVVLHGALKQLVATLKGIESVCYENKPNVNIYTESDCDMSITSFVNICAEAMRVTTDEILSRRRTQDVALARMCAIYFARKEGYKVMELSNYFARDHSNISHACQKIDVYLECDRELTEKINQVRDMIDAFKLKKDYCDGQDQ